MGEREQIQVWRGAEGRGLLMGPRLSWGGGPWHRLTSLRFPFAAFLLLAESLDLHSHFMDWRIALGFALFTEAPETHLLGFPGIRALVGLQHLHQPYEGLHAKQ